MSRTEDGGPAQVTEVMVTAALEAASFDAARNRVWMRFALEAALEAMPKPEPEPAGDTRDEGLRFRRSRAAAGGKRASAAAGDPARLSGAPLSRAPAAPAAGVKARRIAKAATGGKEEG